MRLSKARRQMEATAFHEAGHAVAAYVMSRPIAEVTIVPDEARGTRGQCTFRPLGDAFRPDVRVDGRTRRQIEAMIVSACSGLAAEDRLLDRRNWRGAHSDLQAALDLASYVTASDEEAAAYVNWLFVRATALVAQPAQWAAIRALAAELIEHGRLGARQARSVIRDAMRAARVSEPPTERE